MLFGVERKEAADNLVFCDQGTHQVLCKSAAHNDEICTKESKQMCLCQEECYSLYFFEYYNL